MEPKQELINTLEFSLPGDLYGSIESDTPFRWGREACLLAGAYIPGMKDASLAGGLPDLSVDHIESLRSRVEGEEFHVTLEQLWDGEPPLDLYHLVYSISRGLFHSYHYFPVHGACVGDASDYSLIVGHSGAGKSSLALQLVKESGMKVFSGNKTLLSFEEGKIRALAGTRTMTIKEEDEYRWRELIHDPLAYWGRLAFELKPDSYSQDAEVYVAKIILPKINEQTSETKQLSPQSAVHTLFPYIMDQVNAHTVIGQSVYVGPRTEGVEEYLAYVLETILEGIPVYSITGSMDYLVKQVSKL